MSTHLSGSRAISAMQSPIEDRVERQSARPRLCVRGRKRAPLSAMRAIKFMLAHAP